MNKLLLISIGILLMGSIWSCKENTGLFHYETERSSIYFGFKFPTNSGAIHTVNGVDSIAFSFTTIDLSENTYVLKVPVHVTGLAASRDREFKFTVVDSLTTLESTYYRVLRSTIGKDKYIDSLEIEVQNHEALRDRSKTLAVKLLENEHFDSGYFKNQMIKLNVSDILPRPTWWDAWQGVFGPYSQEKFQMWKAIYHERADGYLSYRYNYDNMPPTANAAFYPTTFVFIRQLQEYFQNNVVYEGGNPNNPRVTIPYQF